MTTAFTATASPDVLARIRKHLFAERASHLIEATPDRPKIAYGVVSTLSKEHTLVALLRKTGSPATQTLGAGQPPPSEGQSEAGPAAWQGPAPGAAAFAGRHGVAILSIFV